MMTSRAVVMITGGHGGSASPRTSAAEVAMREGLSGNRQVA
ncbi:hypothetical protein [Nonomuraea sp. NPDC049758]